MISRSAGPVNFYGVYRLGLLILGGFGGFSRSLGGFHFALACQGNTFSSELTQLDLVGAFRIQIFFSSNHGPYLTTLANPAHPGFDIQVSVEATLARQHRRPANVASVGTPEPTVSELGTIGWCEEQGSNMIK